MSDAVSLSLSPALAESLVGATTVPQTFRFAKQRWQSAILSLLGSVAMSASGVFLLTEIPMEGFFTQQDQLV